MKTSKRALLGGAAVAAVVALALTGCSGGQPASSASGKTTITWWAWDSNPVQKTMVAAFEKDNPNITVNIKNFTTGTSDYENALRPALTSNNGPDVFQIAPGAMLTNYGPLAVDLTPYAEKAWGSDWKSKFYSTATSQLALNGTQPALPTYMTAAGMIFYNSGLVKQLGISVPTTVPQWIQTCKKVNAAGLTCLAQGAKDAWVNEDVFISLANSADPGYIYKAIDGKAKWSSPAMVSAMTAFQSLFTQGVAGKGATAMTQYPDAQNMFLSNKAVFIAQGTWNTPGTMTKTGIAGSQQGLSTKINGVFLSAPFPGATADDQPTLPFGGVANGWGINAKSPNKDAAFKLIEFLSGGKGQTMIGTLASFPSLKSAKVSTSDLVDPSTQVPDVQRQQESLSKLVGIRNIPYPDLDAAVGQALSAVAAGTQSPKAALSAIQTASDSASR